MGKDRGVDVGWGRPQPGQTPASADGAVMGGGVQVTGAQGHVSSEGCLLQAGSVDWWGARTQGRRCLRLQYRVSLTSGSRHLEMVILVRE